MDGDTLILVVLAPLSHIYVAPPLAVKIVLVPEHTFRLPVIIGVGLFTTVTCTVAVPLQFPFDTVTL